MSKKRLKSNSTTIRPRKSSGHSTQKGVDELVFVVDIASFNRRGYECSSSFQGERVNIAFDDADEGVILSRPMCSRVGLEKGSSVLLSADNDERVEMIESIVAGVDEWVRLSNSRLYYLVGGWGGAIIRIRKA